MTTSSTSSAQDSQTHGIWGWVSSLTLRRMGSLVLLLALLVTSATFLLQTKLNYPEILLDPAPLANSLVVQGEGIILLSFVGLLLDGGLMVVISLGLASSMGKKNGRLIRLTGGISGVCWIIGTLSGLVLVPLWGSASVVLTQFFATLSLVTAQIITPIGLFLWTVTLARQFRAYRVLGWFGAIGLLVTFIRSLFWGINALLPIEAGFYATTGILNILALLGNSFWQAWLWLFGIYLVTRFPMVELPKPETGNAEKHPIQLVRRCILQVATGLGIVLVVIAFVLASTVLTIGSQPNMEGDAIPSEPSFGGTLTYLAAMTYLNFVNPIHTIAQQLTIPQSKMPLPVGVSLEHVDASGVPADIIAAPGASKSRWILYLHGGGWAQAGTDDNRAFVAKLSQATGASALYPDYRLTPEHPFPAGLNDCVTAYRWLLNQGVPASHIVIAGESAGGNLTLATAVALRASGDELPAALVALSPATDMAMTGVTYQTKALVDPILGSGLPQDAFALYTNHGATDLRNPLVSPLYGNVQGLPPTFIQVGTQEVLLSDSTRMANRLKTAGVEVKLEIWPGMWHTFSAGAGLDYIPEVRLAQQHMLEFIRQHLGE
jgi:monoterpene epsilon-lactone hydrolase